MPGRRDLLMNTAGNTFSEIDPSYEVRWIAGTRYCWARTSGARSYISTGRNGPSGAGSQFAAAVGSSASTHPTTGSRPDEPRVE